MADKKKPKRKKQQITEPALGGTSLWIGVIIIGCIALFIWILKATGTGEQVIADDLLIRKTVRDQFDAVFEQDREKYLNAFSTDFNNEENRYENLVANIQQALEIKFEVFDFYIEFLPSGEDEALFHFDEERGFASAFAYTFWKQRKEGDIGKDNVLKLGAWLLRKKDGEWKIISDRSIPLKQKEDASHLMITPQFKKFIDPSTFDWPPAPPPPKPEPQDEPEVESGETGPMTDAPDDEADDSS